MPASRPLRGPPRPSRLRRLFGALGAALARLPGARRASSRSSDAIGREGERLAARALRRDGLRLLGRRVVTKGGEVDLLADDRGTLVLVEVKTTRAGSAAATADPLARIDAAKRARLVAAARRLHAERRGARAIRVDVVRVVLRREGPAITRIEGAVRWSR